MAETNRIELKRELTDKLSLPRNKVIMRIYKDLAMVEQLGSGVPRILKHYPKECFKVSDNFVRMEFPTEGVVDVEGGQVGGSIGGQVDALPDRKKEVLGYIIENPTISRKQLSLKMGINESAVQKHIEALKKKHIIVRESETTGSWKVNL
jgi:ATP-dependent DNA helicase RecG